MSSFDINSPTRTTINLQAAEWFQKPDPSQVVFYKKGIYLSREIRILITFKKEEAEKCQSIKLMIDKLLLRGDAAAIYNILTLNEKDKNIITVTQYNPQTCGIKVPLDLTKEKATEFFQSLGRDRAYSEPLSPRIALDSPTRSPSSLTRSPVSPTSPVSAKMESKEKERKSEAKAINCTGYAVVKDSPRRGSMPSDAVLSAAIKKMQTKKPDKA